MTLTLDIPQELESELSAQAARLGLPLGEYALRLLEGGRSSGDGPMTGAELVAFWREGGLIGSRPEIDDSPEHARRLRSRADSRDRG